MDWTENIKLPVIFRIVHENGIPMGILWEMSHAMGWDSSHCISHETYWTEIDEQEIENLLNEHRSSNMSARMIMNCELF